MLKTFLIIALIINFFVLNRNNDHDKENYLENINENYVVDNSKIHVTIQFDCKRKNINYKLKSDIEYNRKIIEYKRKTNKNYYASLEKKYENILQGYDFSQYSPFAFKTYNSFHEYNLDREKLIKMSKKEKISKIYVDYVIENNELTSAIANDLSSSYSGTLEDAKTKIGITSNLIYTGNDIKVGIVDGGNVDISSNFLNGEIIEYNTHNSGTSLHATKVASIIGGTYGIAPDTELFIHSFDPEIDGYDLDDAVSWLISKGVSVINLSINSDIKTNNYGEYDGYSAYLDYVSWNNDVIFVNSAGNRGDSDNYITNPGLGINTLTVGSVDLANKVSYYSSWDTKSNISDIVIKPNLVAPGENIYVSNVDSLSEGIMNGTSFSAPMVTGMISLLLEEFPQYMNNPEAIISALSNGSTYVFGQYDLWDEVSGTGLINYENTRNILSDEQKISTKIVGSSYDNGDIVDTKDIYLNANSAAEIFLSYRVRLGNNQVSSAKTIPSFTKYKIEIYDGESLVDTIISNKNLLYYLLSNNTTTMKRYTIKVILNSEKVNVDNEYIALTIGYEHSHIYDQYLQYNAKLHKSYCNCGENKLESHIFSTINGVTKCIYCKYISSNNITPINPILSNEVTAYTNNGSYIFQDETIYLSELDLNNYKNNTLEFIQKNI